MQYWCSDFEAWHSLPAAALAASCRTRCQRHLAADAALGLVSHHHTIPSEHAAGLERAGPRSCKDAHVMAVSCLRQSPMAASRRHFAGGDLYS